MKKLILFLIVPAAILAGCGGSDGDSGETSESPATSGGGSNAAAIQLFDDNGCAGCHTLSEADAQGPLGPELDGANLNVDEVRSQIENGGGSMPAFKDQLTQPEIDQLAEFVSEASQS
jgi:mono/diheme cytochrome c family protein